MFNLNTLDTIIAVVVVLLVLSLVVQAIQSALKKLFKIKSRQIEESLVDLFENVLDTSTKKAAKRRRLPTLRLLPFVKDPSDKASDAVKSVFNAVIKEFSGIGRVAASGRRMLESISKEDLMKVLRKVGPNILRPTFVTELETACQQFTQLKKAIEAVKAENLSGEASAKFAKMQEAVAPLLNDIQCLFKTDGATGTTTFNKDLLLADILNLREIRAGHVLDLLGEVQKKVRDDLTAQPEKEALKELDKNLNNIAAVFTKLHKTVDEVMTPLRGKLREIESWYDTVMKSFEERYNRGMKTYAFVISLVVAVWLNANIFNIYQDISANADKRAAIVNAGQGALQSYQEQLGASVVTGNQVAKKELKELIETTKEDIEKHSKEYATFGFKTWKDEWKFLFGDKQKSTAELDDKQKSAAKQGFWEKVLHVLTMLLGWLIMAALLSLGAPFWHDALESLFGVKNLLRKRGEIKNVETVAGDGQPQT